MTWIVHMRHHTHQASPPIFQTSPGGAIRGCQFYEHSPRRCGLLWTSHTLQRTKHTACRASRCASCLERLELWCGLRRVHECMCATCCIRVRTKWSICGLCPCRWPCGRTVRTRDQSRRQHTATGDSSRTLKPRLLSFRCVSVDTELVSFQIYDVLCSSHTTCTWFLIRAGAVRLGLPQGALCYVVHCGNL